MKRKKANMHDLPDFFKSERVVSREGNIRGTRFTLCSRLTEEEKANLNKYHNVIYGTAVYRYAPEIVHDTVILTDTCIN